MGASSIATTRAAQKGTTPKATTAAKTTQEIRVEQAAAKRKAEAEAKVRAEAQAKARAEAEIKAKAEAEAKAKADQQAKTQRESNPLYGLSPEEIAEYGKNQGLKQRFGSELSWLDDAFKLDPTLLGDSRAAQAKADPVAIAAQAAAGGRAAQLANRNLDFQDPRMQQQLLAEWERSQATGNPTFDDARQREQYGNLQGIIAGGGATSIEMADRARQRGDSEAWLRGQREADMADYAERGLTGSGMELLALSSDRQAAAGRNSLADLETAKALEERRLNAITSAGDLSSMMRTQDYNEKTYGDKRTQEMLKARTDLTNKMRDQTTAEQIANSNAQQAGVNSWADIADKMRTSSFDESFKTGGAADDQAKWNANTVNAAKESNIGYWRDSRDAMIKQSQDRWKQLLDSKQVSAEKLMDFDQKDNIFGSAQATQLGIQDTDQFAQYLDAYRRAMMTASNPKSVLDAQKNTTGYIGDAGGVIGAGVDEIIKSVTGGGAIEAAGSIGGGAKGGATASSTSPSTAQASILPQGMSADDLKKLYSA